MEFQLSNRVQGVSAEQRGSGSLSLATGFREFQLSNRVQGVSAEQQGSGSFS